MKEVCPGFLFFLFVFAGKLDKNGEVEASASETQHNRIIQHFEQVRNVKKKKKIKVFLFTKSHNLQDLFMQHRNNNPHERKRIKRSQKKLYREKFRLNVEKQQRIIYINERKRVSEIRSE